MPTSPPLTILHVNIMSEWHSSLGSNESRSRNPCLNTSIPNCRTFREKHNWSLVSKSKSARISSVASASTSVPFVGGTQTGSNLRERACRRVVQNSSLSTPPLTPAHSRILTWTAVHTWIVLGLLSGQHRPSPVHVHRQRPENELSE